MSARSLLVTEYESAWDPGQAPSPPPSWVGGAVKVEQFMDLFLTPQFFGKLVVWTWDLAGRTRRQLGIPRESEFSTLSLEQSRERRRALSAASFSEGCLPVLCVPRLRDSFRRAILSSGHYAEGREFKVQDGRDKHSPLSALAEAANRLFGILLKPSDIVFAFSHDADQLYEIEYAGLRKDPSATPA